MGSKTNNGSPARTTFTSLVASTRSRREARPISYESGKMGIALGGLRDSSELCYRGECGGSSFSFSKALFCNWADSSGPRDGFDWLLSSVEPRPANSFSGQERASIHLQIEHSR